MSKAEFTAAEVLTAVRAWLAAGAAGDFELTHRELGELQRLAGFDVFGVRNSWDRTRAEDKFSGQVKRALDKVAAEGALVRIGKNQTLPTGGWSSGVHYFTPAAAEQADRERQEREAGREAERARWTALHEALAALGFENCRHTSDGLVLDLDRWEKLVQLARQGTELPTHVRFAHPDNGYDGAREHARKFLEPGQVYTIRALSVGQSSSYLELYEVSGQRFGTEFFEPHDPREPE